MSAGAVWLTALLLGIGSPLLKGVGPLFLGGRSLPERLTGAVRALAPAMLAALVATQAFVVERDLVFDARAIGLCAALIALSLRAPTLVVVAVAALATALARAI